MLWNIDNPEYTEAADRYVDYCLWEYEPLTSTQDKLRSVNLLYHSFQVAGVDDSFVELCQTIQSSIGESKTVWGVKYINGQLSWELYFYDYARLEREVSITKLLKVIEPHVDCKLKANDLSPYFMFSIDLNADILSRRKPMSSLNIYLGNMGCEVSSGISYTLTENNLVFDNLYYFFDPKKELDSIVGKISSSAYVSLSELDINEILWPEMVDCGCIVIANKRQSDGVYFSRITHTQLIYFMKRCNYPMELISYIEDNVAVLDHLLYDVGMDYRIENGQLNILKSSYYGSF